jgi:hypothetical protein
LIRSTLAILTVVLFSKTAMAKSYTVYQADTPQAHILQQPVPGVFLGQMMRHLGLKPDWTNRFWIQSIHQANPGTVDAAGEILFHVEKLKIPLAAMKTLPGYSRLENDLQPEPAPVVPVAPEPPQKPFQEVAEAPVEMVDENQSANEYGRGSRIWADLGAGAAFFSADNNQSRNADLSTEFNIIGAVGYLGQLHPNHQIYFQFLGQYKTYLPPDNIGVLEDANFLITFQYAYGYRLYRSLNVRLIGQSQQMNFATFPGSVIDLFTYWNHMAGIQVAAPLFDLWGKQLAVDLAGFYTLETSSDFAMDNGFQARLGISFESKAFESGYRIGLLGVYHNQLPTGFLTHQSVEGFATVGYQF